MQAVQPVIERRFSAGRVSLAGGGASASSSGRTVLGDAVVFNRESDVLTDARGEFLEIILPGALDSAAMDDVTANVGHDDSKLLARSRNGKGTLELMLGASGLKYRFEAPNTTLGNDVVELLRRGDLDGSSFAFSIASGGDSWGVKDGMRFRTIRRIARIYDVAVVAHPAYGDTTANVRADRGSKLTERQAELARIAASVGRFLDADALRTLAPERPNPDLRSFVFRDPHKYDSRGHRLD